MSSDDDWDGMGSLPPWLNQSRDQGRGPQLVCKRLKGEGGREREPTECRGNADREGGV